MTAPTARAAFVPLSAQETLLALPRSRSTVPVTSAPRLPTRQVLEEILLTALSTTPCYVLFSGGRDSSALLALAVHVARREGLPAPVPVTVRHPAAPESDETRWQELVLAHLRLPGQVVLEFDGEQRLLGEVARAALRRHGPVWPEAVQLHGAAYRHLEPGATVVSGEGGDILLDGHRMGNLRDALTLRRPRRASLRGGLRAVRPRALVRREVRRSGAAPPWLRPAAATEYLRELEHLVSEPLRWDAATRTIMASRAPAVFAANFDAAITEYGLLPVTPFNDPRVAGAIARQAGPLGWGDRTAIFRRLFHDLLPDEVLRRRSKAAFNSTRWGPEERAFARGWDGSGLDPAWVDAEELRAAWLSDRHHPSADFLLHVAWARAEGIDLGDSP
ncbi:asparagine synthase (glutamine-hydrolysing) [Georgenia satyanarayanai]|uniref:Asparagine synthase (Glutamine-hydrolysing) n=1 Tax=Georgenia satyanarayanai TaxID=860221 RepID=A0A2Y9A7X9_9MICO|nr:asparagine synthase C-terminal domain-containing protein [Georgenia satyanarayanai]PYG00687.1 asparagine synthase (glutamine-hydrolysing) [Georgenia satyanarayanai]SSA40076.1 asparagine synthase (glutamine-hydrolysing) [Georgenia satyanarayanai]